MSGIVRFLPGLIGAIAGFLTLFVLTWIDVQSVWLRFLIFLTVYAVVTVSVDRALKAYGRHI